MNKGNFIPPETGLQIRLKSLMSKKLRRIAQIERVGDPAALVLLQMAKLINDKEREYKQRGIPL